MVGLSKENEITGNYADILRRGNEYFKEQVTSLRLKVARTIFPVFFLVYNYYIKSIICVRNCIVIS